MTALLDNYADRINEHHEQAHSAAEKAINHAMEAGRLLLEVKAALQHGCFKAWAEDNLTVSLRQAQRYMRVAQGKPNIRTLATETMEVIGKSDTVSLLNDGWPLPDWMPTKGVSYSWADEVQAFWVVASDRHDGFFHVSRLYSSGDDSFCDCTKRPVRADAVEPTLKHLGCSNPASIDWVSRRGFSLSRPFGEPDKTATA